jgi:hypothetical protein
MLFSLDTDSPSITNVQNKTELSIIIYNCFVL